MAPSLMPSRPEIDLLLQCTRTRLGATHITSIQDLLATDLNWDDVLQTARQHKVAPLLYHNLNTINSPAIPKAVSQQLRQQFQTNLRRNLLMTAELFKLLKLLSKHNIPAIPYKGPALAATIYGELALRQFMDLDILIRQPDMLTVQQLLRQQGYQPLFTLTPGQEHAYLRSGCELSFYDAKKRINLDLHWHVVRPYMRFALRPDQLQAHLAQINLSGQTIQSLTREPLLLILAMHHGKHHWERLSWICDVAELLHRYPDLQWDQLFTQARQLGITRMLKLALVLARDLLDAPLPPAISQRIQSDPVIPTLAADMHQKLFQETPRRFEGLDYHVTTLKMRERWRDRIQYSARLAGALTIDDLKFVSLPPWLSRLYYLIRPLRLVVKWVKRKFSLVL